MFEIDYSTLTMSVVLFIALSSPFVYYSFKSKKQLKLLTRTFLDFASSIGAKPTKIETWRNEYWLGYDPVSKIVVCLRIDSKSNQSFFKLSDVKEISIHEKTHLVESSVEKRNVLDYIGIRFYFKDVRKQEKSLELYESETFSGQDGEVVLAKKWADYLREQLTN
jgi:hypothetical protein